MPPKAGSIVVTPGTPVNLPVGDYATLMIFCPTAGLGLDLTVKSLSPNGATVGKTLTCWLENPGAVEGSTVPTYNSDGTCFDQAPSMFDVSGYTNVQITSTFGSAQLVFYQLADPALTFPSAVLMATAGPAGKDQQIIFVSPSNPLPVTPSGGATANPCSSAWANDQFGTNIILAPPPGGKMNKIFGVCFVATGDVTSATLSSHDNRIEVVDTAGTPVVLFTTPEFYVPAAQSGNQQIYNSGWIMTPPDRPIQTANEVIVKGVGTALEAGDLTGVVSASIIYVVE